ncbi:hypothetical protein K4H03_26215, partial [Mycobacterium tuberculosis]|nr:hypothetical protein [Mycobacterium tuberculosis]
TLDTASERERLTGALEEAANEVRRYSKRYAAGAQKELERLTKLAPDSPELKASRNEMKSNTGEGRQALQQARLLGVAGKVDEAIAAYEK